MTDSGTAPDAGGDDVMAQLRSATRVEHERVEETLALLDPELTRQRLIDVLERMHAFWIGAERGLDDWAQRFPGQAADLEWSRRRRARLFAADLAVLGGTRAPGTVPALPELRDTDDALGRLYVLEGSTLGGVFIDRHLAEKPDVSGGARLQAFSPYGADTGAMWHAFRRITREHAADGGDVARIVGSARATFTALTDWCASAPERASA